MVEQNIEQNIIPLGARCKLSGRLEIPAIVSSRTLGSEDGKVLLVLDFEGVVFSCASEGYYQSKFPKLLHLLLRVNEDQEDDPSGKLFNELEKLQCLQKRSHHIFGDDVPIDDLNNIPIKYIDEVFSQRDFNTGLRYKTTVITVERDAVTQETES